MRLQLYRGVWCAVWTEAGRTRRASLRTDDRELAEQRFADAKRRPVGDTVSAIMAAYIADLEEREKDAPRARYAWKALQPHFGALRPDQIDRAACRLYVRARIAAGRKSGTASKELDTLASALRWHDKNTPAIVELPPKAPPRDRWLTKAEFEKLVEGAASEHARLFIELARSTAGRAEAILQLTWDRVDFQRGVIRLSLGNDPRQKRRATVPITNRVRPLLEAAKRAALTEHVIEYGGAPVASIKKAFGRAAERAGLPWVTPHVIRHSVAVWMAEDGVPMSEISQYLGHSNSRVTESVYARFSPTALRRAAASVE